MSFILDALRKSEHERQRTTGPGLAEVAIAPSKPRTNVWATAAVVLLVVNLVAIGVLLLRKAQHEATGNSVATIPGPEAATGPEAAPPAAGASAQPAPQASITRTLPEPPPMLRPAEAVPVVPATRNPLEQEVSADSSSIDPQMAAAAAAAPEGPPAVSRAPTRGGTVVYETLPDASIGEAAAYPPPAQSQRGSRLPTADEVMARGGVPDLRLELHVYSNRPQERFAFINSRKYREGETLAEGPQVEEITPDGVVLNLRGNRFLLPRE
jgi:general secretion pathway protein B